MANYKTEFEKRDVKVMALSVDGLKSHKQLQIGLCMAFFGFSVNHKNTFYTLV